MKFIKLFFILILLLSQLVTFSQSKKITLKTQFELEGVNSDTDSIISRTIDIQLFYNNSFNSIHKIESKKCSNLYTVPKFNGKFKALISSENHLPAEIRFEINDQSPDTLLLKTKLYSARKPEVLSEVVIKSTTSPIKIEGNKTSYSVKNNDALNNGTALETVQKLPGVMSDINGNITLKGKNVTVHIDGMPTNMSGQDLTNYLNSISSSSVSKVEITNNPGASFDANTSADVINIVTTIKNKKGINGSIYSAATVYRKQKFENNFTLNGLLHKANWNLNLGYSAIESENGMHKLILDKSNNNTIDDNYLNQNTFKPLSVRTGISFPIKDNTFDIKYSISNNKQTTNNFSKYIGNDTFESIEQLSNGIQKTVSIRNEVTTNFLHKFKNPEKTFSLNYQFYNFNKNLDTQNNSVLINTHYQNLNKNEFTSKAHKIKGDLSLPLKLFRMNTGFKLTNSNILSDGNYNTINAIATDIKKIHFNYDDYTAAIYTELYKKYKDFDFTFGLRYEYITFENKTNGIENTKQNYSNFFPSFNIGYQLNSFTDINLSYSRKIKLPGYQELDPNSNGIINNLVTDGGNPLLKPSFYNNTGLKINIFKYASLDVTYSQTNNENYFVLTKGDNNSYKQTYETFNNVRNLSSSIAIPVPLGIFTKGLNYLNNISDINNINYLYLFSGIKKTKYIKTGYDNNFNSLYYFGGYSQFLLPFDTKMNLQYTFSSKGNYTIYNLEKPFNKIDMTLSKSIFKNSTKIQIAFNDIFNTGKGFNALFANNNINVNVTTLNDSQRIKFSITYNFGGFKNNNTKEEIDERENKKNSIDVKL